MFRHLFHARAARPARLGLLGGGLCVVVAILAALVVMSGATARSAGAAPATTAGAEVVSGADEGARAPQRPVVPGRPGSDGFGPDTPTGVTRNNWTNLFPALYQISAASSTEAWARGENPGELLHFTAGTWTTVTPTALSGLYIGDIKMISPSIGWLSAYTVTAGYVFRYDGTAWTDMSAGLGQGLRVYRLAVTGGQSNFWGTGATCDVNNHCLSSLVHWNGTTWAAAGPALGATASLVDIHLPAPAEGWAVGYDPTTNPPTPRVFHYDGTSWTPRPAPPATTYLDHVVGVGGGQAWVIGEDTSYVLHLYRYAGGAWTQVTIPDGSDPHGIFMLTPTQGWLATSSGVLAWNGTAWTPDYAGRSMQAVSAVPGQVWAVGDAESIVAKSGAGPWTLQRGAPTTQDLLGVWTLSPDEAWAVGGGGTFLHYLGGAWHAVSTPFTDTVWAVQMISPTEGYAVGADLIARWDGTSWTRAAQPFTDGRGLYALAMTGSGEGWAVGSNGYIWHATGGVWSQWHERPVSQFLLGIAMDSPTHGWAVGGYNPGKLLEYTGGSWVDRSALLPPGTPSLQGITTGPNPGEAWAGVAFNSSCSDQALLHYQGGTWSWVSGVTACAITGFAHEALGELWASGGFPFYHYSGGAWQSVNIPASIWPLQGISLVPGRGGWAVGYAGQIIQYNPLAPGQRFYDVPLSNPFTPYIEYMAAHNIVSGYGDNTFHPYSNITRAQLTKMVVNGLAWPPVTPPTPTFADVPTTHPFYSTVETAAAHGVISGYTCGGPGEPCDAQHRPYFRPGNNVTRAQLAKIIVGAKGWGPANPPTPTFADVPVSSPFYGVVEQAAAHGIISGYGCGGPGEPCPGTYFRPANSATRGQLSKILYLALTGP